MKKKILAIFLIFVFSQLNCAAELVVDDSIHEQISQKYELEKLPELPSGIYDSADVFTPNEFDTEPNSKYTPVNDSETKNNVSPKNQTVTTPTTKNQIGTKTDNKSINKNQASDNIVNQWVQKGYIFDNNYETIKIRKGKSFKVVNNIQLLDNMKRGTEVIFVTTATETNRYVTIPKGTVFKGRIEDSHTPNLGANGGLLVIKIVKMVYNGRTYPVDAKITLANQKHIFLNNIKGKHMYWKNAVKSTKKGKKVYDRMWAKTKKYFKPGIEIIITPVTFLTGTIVYGANIVASPVLALFSKGGRLIIPKNSSFVIKLIDDAILYK